MPSECTSCQGTGFRLTTDASGVVSSTRCECELEQLGDRLLQAAHIPSRYEHCSFERFELPPPSDPTRASYERALHDCKAWAASFPGVDWGMMLLGGPGRGKTHLAVAMAQELILEKKTRLLFYEQRTLLKTLQGTFESGAGQQESEVLRPVLETELLILDDVGAGRTTPWAREVMHDIIAQRYNEQKPMIITSNLSTGEDQNADFGTPHSGATRHDRPLTLRDRLGDALLSRLYEMCRIVSIEGFDYRKKARAHRTCS